MGKHEYPTLLLTSQVRHELVSPVVGMALVPGSKDLLQPVAASARLEVMPHGAAHRKRWQPIVLQFPAAVARAAQKLQWMGRGVG